MKDTLGTELNNGDLVAYGYRVGNSGGICFAIVTNAEKNAIFSGGVQQGYGVDGDRLILLASAQDVNSSTYNPKYKEQYDILMQTAKKWL